MPTFYESGELRWFLRDSLAQWDLLLRWFRRQDQAVDHYFTAHGAAPVTLEARDSLSYPAWLAERL